MRKSNEAGQTGCNPHLGNETEARQMQMQWVGRSKLMPDLQPGDLVILKSIPASLLRGLPEEDQIEIRKIVGKPVIFAGSTYGQAELEFKDSHGDEHTIWVERDRIKPA